MKIGSLINSLEFYFSVSFVFYLAGYFYSGELIEYDVGALGFVMHALATLSFLVGVALASPCLKINYDGGPVLIPRRGFYLVSYFFSVLGLVVTLYQVSLSVNIFDYLSSLFGGAFVELREAFLLSSSEGGLPGPLKMLANTTLGVVLMVFGLLYFCTTNPREKNKLKQLLIFSVFVLFLKIVFSLDRVSIFAIMFPFLFLAVKNRWYRRVFFYIAAFLFVFSLNFISSKRLEGYGIVDFVMLYFYLGIVNLEVTIDTLSGHTFGFNTLLAPLNFVFEFFSIEFDLGTDFDWVWNPAQYGVGYAYMDFGIFFFLFFLVLGVFARYITVKSYSGKLIFCSSYFVFVYGLMSFVTVPVIRGLEFYVALIVSVVIPFLFCRVACSDYEKLVR